MNTNNNILTHNISIINKIPLYVYEIIGTQKRNKRAISPNFNYFSFTHSFKHGQASGLFHDPLPNTKYNHYVSLHTVLTKITMQKNLLRTP